MHGAFSFAQGFRLEYGQISLGSIKFSLEHPLSGKIQATAFITYYFEHLSSLIFRQIPKGPSFKSRFPSVYSQLYI